MGQYNIQRFGARGDGTVLNTRAIQAALNRCADEGGGRVVIPPGRFVTGGLTLRSGVNLHLMAGAELVASLQHKDFKRRPSPRVESFCGRGGFYALLYAEGERDVVLSGKGTIDGQGTSQQSRPGSHARPDQDGRHRNVLFISCRDVRIQNLTIRDAGCWNLHCLDCDDVTVRGVTIHNHGNRNNDGLDIDSCRRVTVSGCMVDSDDDGICLKANTHRPCDHIIVKKCIVGSKCNAIKLGTESIGGFRNVRISDCTITGSSSPGKGSFGSPQGGWSGITINQMDGGHSENIVVDNVTVHGPCVPFFIRLGPRGYTIRKGGKRREGGILRHVRLSNITATTSCKWGCGILGSPDMPIEDMVLKNIRLSFPGGAKRGPRNVPERPDAYPQPDRWKTLPAFGFFLRHVHDVKMKNIRLSCRTPDVRPPVVTEDTSFQNDSEFEAHGKKG